MVVPKMEHFIAAKVVFKRCKEVSQPSRNIWSLRPLCKVSILVATLMQEAMSKVESQWRTTSVLVMFHLKSSAASLPIASSSAWKTVEYLPSDHASINHSVLWQYIT